MAPAGMTVGRTQHPPQDQQQCCSAARSSTAPIYAPHAAGRAAAEDPAKRLSTLVARAALVGVIVHRIESDFGGEEFIATKWALTKSFSSMDALEAWLDKVIGQNMRPAQ